MGAAVIVAAAVFGVSSVVVAGDAGDASLVVSSLGKPAGPADALPRGIDPAALGEGGIVESRHLGADDLAAYWVATDRTGQICVIAVLPSGVAGAACNSPAHVEVRGLGLGLGGNELAGDPAIVVRLLPDSAAVTPVVPWHEVGPNLLVSEQADVSVDVVTLVPRERGEPGAPIPVTG